jgi:nitroreductase
MTAPAGHPGAASAPAAQPPLTAEQVLWTTRTVRRRLDLDRPVDLALVMSCLRTALQAPSGGNRQDWRWLVLTDPAVRAGVAEVYRRAFADYWHARPDPAGLRAPAGHLASNLHRVPVLVIPCLEVRGPLPPGNQAGLWGSVLPAAWSYMLAARAAGLAVAWTATHLTRESEVAELLGIPQTVRQAALLPTAHPVGRAFRPARRRPVEEVVHLNGWTGRTPPADAGNGLPAGTGTGGQDP